MMNIKIGKTLFLLSSFVLICLLLPGEIKAQDCAACAGTCCCTNPAGCQYNACSICNAYGCHSGYAQTCRTWEGCWDQCCGTCFTGETEISLGQEGERAGEQEGATKQIKDLKPGDVVKSFDPETGEITEGTVSDVTKTTREGYYILETESGEKVKVTAEHPFLAVKNQESVNQVSNFRERITNILSQTLTYKVITGLQAKIGEVLK